MGVLDLVPSSSLAALGLFSKEIISKKGLCTYGVKPRAGFQREVEKRDSLSSFNKDFVGLAGKWEGGCNVTEDAAIASEEGNG